MTLVNRPDLSHVSDYESMYDRSDKSKSRDSSPVRRATRRTSRVSFHPKFGGWPDPDQIDADSRRSKMPALEKADGEVVDWEKPYAPETETNPLELLVLIFCRLILLGRS